MMNKVDIGSDDFLTGSTFVKLGNVASAIGKVLLANGSPNKFQAERDAWPFIHTGIVEGKLHPLAPETLNVLSINDYGNGVVGFDELVEWGLWCKRFEFVKQPELSAQDEYVPLPILLADYWVEPLSELPENLRELVEDWWDMTKPQYRPGMARSYDVQHDPALASERKAGGNFGYWSAVASDVGDAPDWEYWARFKYLTPIKAACLFVELAPDNYPTIKEPAPHYNTPQYNGLVKYIDRLADYAETDNEGMKLSPAQWIEWAQGKGYVVPEEFIKAVADVVHKEQEKECWAQGEQERNAQENAPAIDVKIQSEQVPIEDNSENFSQYVHWFLPLNTKGLAAMFKVKIDSEDRETKKRGTENLDWWKARINEAYRLPLLSAAKEKRGRYNPAKVADYLVNEGHLNAGQCRRMMRPNVSEKYRDDAIVAWGENLI